MLYTVIEESMRKWLFLLLAIGFFCGYAFAADPAASPLPTPPWGAEEVTEHPGPPSPDRFYQEFLHMLTVLGLILLVLLGVTWFLKRMLNVRVQQINATSPIKVIEKRALTPKTAIYVLEIYDKRIAIAESHNGVTSLGELKEEEIKDFKQFMTE